MSHLDPQRPATPSDLRNFGLLVGGAFLVIAGFTFWRERAPVVFGSLGVLGGILLLTGLTVPTWLSRAYRGWMAFAVVLSKITTPIFMGVIYFGVLTPMGLLMRAFGRNPLSSKAASSGWVIRAPEARRSALGRQF